jgi:predicted nucleotidyltransferase
MNYPLYRDSLCPKIWHMDEDGYRLDTEVRNGLSKIAQDFVDGLKKDHKIDIKIHDVVIIGSIANYNWTDYSDIDMHIITDYSDLEMSKDDAQTLFDAIKVNWNNKHDIKMKGHDVELYVQDIDHEAVSTAEYSVIQNKWIKEPKKEAPTFNKDLIKKKYKEYKSKINSLTKSRDENGLKKLLDKLYKFRQAGLDKGGELSEENIVFKILRAHGLLDKVKDGIAKIYDKKMSVTEIAPNYPIRINDDKEYQQGLKIVAQAILKAAKQYGEFPDINPLLEKLSSMFDKNVDEVHTDLARVYSKMTK